MKDEKNKRLTAMRDGVIAWYAAHRRDMPWRADPTPYHVWLSEIMLQQTRIEAAWPYYERFLTEAPTVEALAALPEDRLMKLWQGLGYYSRARNLQKAAQMVTETYGGEMPHTVAELKRLPGIGEYTAGAIASIAYGEAEPAVDGNVLRVIMRLLACEDDVMSPKTRAWVTEALKQIYPSGPRAALLTEGLMELGEVVCIPGGEPRCEVCPLCDLCRGHETGKAAELPCRIVKKQGRVAERTILLLTCEGRYALRRRPEKGLLAGMWEFPGAERFLTEAEVRETAAAWGVMPENVTRCADAKHVFSHVAWQMRGYRVVCRNAVPAFAWQTPEEIARTYAIPTAFRVYAEAIGAR